MASVRSFHSLAYIRQRVSLTFKILFLPACCMDDCSQGNLTRSIDYAGISEEDRVKEGLDLRPEAVHTVH